MMRASHCFTWNMPQELQRIGDVPGPDLVERRSRNQILGTLPALELGDENGEALLCFT